jgi:hypothetical protein
MLSKYCNLASLVLIRRPQRENETSITSEATAFEVPHQGRWICRKDADSVTVELGFVQSAGPQGGPAPMPFGSHTIGVAEAYVPEFGLQVTVACALQA